MRVPPPVKKIRVNIDMHPEVKAELSDIQAFTRADSMSEVMRRALAYYKILIDEADEQKVTTVQIGSKKREFVLF